LKTVAPATTSSRLLAKKAKRMFNTGMSVDILRDCLVAAAPLDLLGMRLLQQRLEQARPLPGLYPTDLPRETLKEAVSEIVDYTGRCTAVARRLSHLAPIPLITVPVLDFGL